MKRYLVATVFTHGEWTYRPYVEGDPENQPEWTADELAARGFAPRDIEYACWRGGLTEVVEAAPAPEHVPAFEPMSFPKPDEG
jgi:hypothetical protein